MDRIIPYSKQDEYDLVNSGQDCMGWTVVDQAGNEIGEVTEMLIDTETEMVDSIIIDNRRRIAARDFALRDEQVVVRGIFEGGNLEIDGETQDVDDFENRRYEATTATGANFVSGVTREAGENEATLPVIEEQLKIGKRAVESGAAHVHTRVEEVPVEETVNLREEKVTVERRPVNRPVEDTPAAFTEGTIEVTEMAEVPVVGKEARVVEEVVIDKEVSQRQETVRDTVKRTDVEVDEIDIDADKRGNR